MDEIRLRRFGTSLQVILPFPEKSVWFANTGDAVSYLTDYYKKFNSGFPKKELSLRIELYGADSKHMREALGKLYKIVD
ncbi:MAG: hypothetical protein QXN71_02860 [Candidatus Aenigmatarchaeota archaeon]